MTDLSQADLNPISAKKIAITLLVTAIVGFIAAFAVWSLTIATSQAIAIVSIGRDQAAAFIEEPQAVIERIKSPGFANAVSARAGISELSTLLPARQYGGSGALAVRNLKDPNVIEIRINLPQPELAQKALNAVVDELIADHSEKTAPLIQILQSTLATLDKNASELVKSGDTIAKNISSNGEISKDSMTLLIARAFTELGLVGVVKTENDLRVNLTMIHRTQAIMVPTVITPKATSLYQTVAAGALAGLLAGLLLLQMLPGFFRTGRHRLGISQPDPV
jgi:hypothetical protein